VMQKSIHGFVLTGCLLLLAGSPQAQGLKIGFVDSTQVLQGTDEGKNVMGELDQLQKNKVTQLEGKQAELQDLQTRLQTGRSSMNGDAVAQLEGQIAQKQRELQRFQEDAQAELTQRQNALLQQMSAKVQTIIDQYAKDNSLAAIFMKDPSQAYVDETLDVTQDIIRLYNEKHPVTGTPATTGQ